MSDRKLIQAARNIRAGNADAIDLDGPLLERFDAQKMAAALEQEHARALVRGWPKISIHLDLADALALAKTLKRSR